MPVDTSVDAPNVADQEKDADSLLNTVKALLNLRHQEEDLQADSDFEVVYAESKKLPFVYRRGSLLIALNPSLESVSVSVPAVADAGQELLFRIGEGKFAEGVIALGAQSAVVVRSSH
ncbi:MAG: DUF3459 domain-containing protein [Lachnospiraceae bacterium]|nr:DUF3459 domain-containing protein [Lachnospiraceae bacterium]